MMGMKMVFESKMLPQGHYEDNLSLVYADASCRSRSYASSTGSRCSHARRARAAVFLRPCGNQFFSTGNDFGNLEG